MRVATTPVIRPKHRLHSTNTRNQGIMHCITLRTIAAQALLALPFARADPTTTVTTTSTTIVGTHWVVIRSLSSTVTTYTTSAVVAGSTIGATTVYDSQSTFVPMAWQGQSLQDAVLNSTNYYRAQHQANPLRWDDSLASYAQNHAQQCLFEHSVRVLLRRPPNPKLRSRIQS